MRKTKEKRGISLIVLVITIIVIIILAVAVILSIANNNPISNANEAVDANDIATLKEATTIAYTDWYTENSLNGLTTDPEVYVKDVLKKQNFKQELIDRLTITNGKIIISEDSETVDVWDGSIDTSWYNETDTVFNLTTAEQLAGLAELANQLNDDYS